MSFLLPLSTFILAISLMVAILVRKNILANRGVIFPHETVKEEHFSRFFSSLHDLERVFLRLSFRAGGHVFERLRLLSRKGVHTLFHKTPLKKISDAVSGKKEMGTGNAEPSAYLKDMTNHRDKIRENGMQE